MTRDAETADDVTQVDSWFSREDLLLEVARLRRDCARAEDMASRHAIMLREGDHRIKNSLQIVAGLMQVQARREASATAREALNGAAARIQSIARIHDALQASHGQDMVDVGATLETMCHGLQAMAGEEQTVSIIVKVEPVQAPVAIAQPIVLAVNELVVNALRHAFTTSRVGEIAVNVARVEGALHVSVADNGAGLPPNYTEGRGYGMRLVRTMASQIGALLSVESQSGTRFSLAIPAAAFARPHASAQHAG